jgi:hypothetical protein
MTTINHFTLDEHTSNSNDAKTSDKNYQGEITDFDGTIYTTITERGFTKVINADSSISITIPLVSNTITKDNIENTITYSDSSI